MCAVLHWIWFDSVGSLWVAVSVVVRYQAGGFEGNQTMSGCWLRRGLAGLTSPLARSADASLFQLHAHPPPFLGPRGPQVPTIHHFDPTRAIIVMQNLRPAVILRGALVEGRRWGSLLSRVECVL